MMPILDGISALAQMRNDGNTTPVLLLTAKDSLQDKVTDAYRSQKGGITTKNPRRIDADSFAAVRP